MKPAERARSSPFHLGRYSEINFITCSILGRESVIGCNFGMRLHLESLDADFDDASRLELVHKIDLCMRVLKTSTYFRITTKPALLANICQKPSFGRIFHETAAFLI